MGDVGQAARRQQHAFRVDIVGDSRQTPHNHPGYEQELVDLGRTHPSQCLRRNQLENHLEHHLEHHHPGTPEKTTSRMTPRG